jgi:hypothetical protein
VLSEREREREREREEGEFQKDAFSLFPSSPLRKPR